MLCLDDPTADASVYRMFDNVFLGVYTAEMALKIFALGFYFPKHAYMRHFWNWIDFIIVVTGYLPFVLSSSINITGLRILRVLRPLRAISFLEELRIIIMSIVKAIPNFINVMMIYAFFLGFFGISALQLFSGILKKRCYQSSTGIIATQSYDSSYVGVLCGYQECPDGYICGKLIVSPNFDVTKFDNIFWSLLMIFQTFTQWFDVPYMIRAFNYYGALIFFIFCSVTGVFLLVNLMISIITSEYHVEEDKQIQNREIKKKKYTLMNIEDYFNTRILPANVKTYKKLKIMIDFSIEYKSGSLDDVLCGRIMREKKKKNETIDKIFRTENFEIHNKPKTYRPLDKEKNKPKWEKRYAEIFRNNQRIAITHQVALRLLKNKKRLNLPLSINNRLVKFLLFLFPMEHKKLTYEKKTFQRMQLKLFSESQLSLNYDEAIDIVNEPILNPGSKINMDNQDHFFRYELLYDFIKVHKYSKNNKIFDN